MKRVEAERYQKTKKPSPEEINFSGPGVAAEQQENPPPSDAQETVSPETRTNELPNQRSNERTDERPNVRTEEPADERPNEESGNSYVIVAPKERVKSRHTFGIFEDQKQALDSLQIAARDVDGKKPSLGEMVREALDDYIETRTNELPNVRTTERMSDCSNEGPNDE